VVEVIGNVPPGWNGDLKIVASALGLPKSQPIQTDQQVLSPVAVEKLTHWKVVEKTL